MKTTKQNNNINNSYKKDLTNKLDNFVHDIYKITRNFPKEEMYGSATQIRRAALSIILNYVEGYARRKPAVQLNFFETSYGSLKEVKYLLYFAKGERWITENEYIKELKLADEVGAMLWTEIKNLDRYVNA